SELLGRIRDRRPLVMFIDDLQWTDHDSVVLLEYLFAEPEPTPWLLIASHRSEGAEQNVVLQRVLLAAAKNARVELRDVAVGQLSAAASQELARRLLGDGPGRDAAAIATEAQGSPFFVGELARFTRLNETDGVPPTLPQALTRHLSVLGDGAARLLGVLAV